MDETWSYHYDPETKQQSMEWRHSGSSRPRKFRVQKSAGEVLASIFLGSRWHPPHWLPSKGPNYQRGELLIFSDSIEGRFEEKTPTPREGHQKGLVLTRQCPGSPDACISEETGLPGLPVSWSLTLFSRFGPVRLPPVPWTEKQLKGRHFLSDAEVSAAAENWWDGQCSDFFWVVCESYSNGIRIVLSFVGSIWINPE